jgi:hypothetical protein
MRRAAAVLAGLAMLGAAAPPAPDCGEQIRAMRAKLAGIKEEPRRQELEKLIEKAEHDRDAGRAEACGKTMRHAQALVK